MRGLLCRRRCVVVACFLVAVLVWGGPVQQAATPAALVRPLRTDVQHTEAGVSKKPRHPPPEQREQLAHQKWPGEANVRMHLGIGWHHKPQPTEQDTVAGKAVLTGLLFLGALSCWTRGVAPLDDQQRYDYDSIPGGGASEGHHLLFVQGHAEYGTMQPAKCPRIRPEAGPPAAGQEFPSGMWYGYYNHGSPVPNPFAICLHFSRGRITDVGEDVIGQFQVSGLYSVHTLRVAFSKQYIFGTGNAPRNEGQLLEYRGTRAPSLGQGLRGTWHMRTSRARIDGNFHIWPVMPNWNPHPPRFMPLPPLPIPAKAGNTTVRIVKVKKKLSIAVGQHCALCVRRPISTLLVPCGHVAFCLPCVRELGSTCTAFCPICQLPVTQVHIEGVPNPKRDASPALGPRPLPGKEVARATGQRRSAEPLRQTQSLPWRPHNPRMVPTSAS